MSVLLDDFVYDVQEVPTTTVTVVVVDDYPIFAETLVRVISDETEFSVTGLASSVSEALSLVGRLHPDLVLMDDELPDGSGADAASEIVRRWPKTKVIMVAGQRNLKGSSLASGHVNFVAKERPARDVLTAMRLVTHLDDVVACSSDAPKALTNREREVLEMLANGTSTARMAAELFVSIHTVRNHVRNILGKLGAHSKLEAVAIARRENIIMPRATGLSAS